MAPDDLNQFLAQFTRALVDPSAPLPALWLWGALGVLLVFATQIGAGIPLGVLMARDAGLNPAVTAGLYLASDVFLALTFEPMLLLLRWLGRHVDWLAALGQRMMRFSGATGLSSGRVKGPLGLVLFSFIFAPAPARAASEAAGHGPLSGWSLAIIGDMVYFGIIMASTLLVISIFGDSRVAIAPVIVAAWLLPMLLQRLRRQTPQAQAVPVRATSVDSPSATRAPFRRSVTHNGRRRRTTRIR